MVHVNVGTVDKRSLVWVAGSEWSLDRYGYLYLHILTESIAMEREQVGEYTHIYIERERGSPTFRLVGRQRVYVYI